MPSFGATSSFGAGQSDLTASPYGRDTSIEDIRKYLLMPDRSNTRGAARPRTAQQQLRAFSGGLGGPQKDTAQDRILNAQATMAEAQARAATTAMPTRQIVGFNMSGPVEDTLAMTGAQREAYLPQNSQIAGKMGPSAASFGHPSNQSMPAEGGEVTDSGMACRAALLGNALRDSNAAYSARQQQSAMGPPSYNFGR